MVLKAALLLTVLFSISMAQAADSSAGAAAILAKPFSERKIALKTIKDPQNKFYLMTSVVTDYAGMPLKAADIKEATSYAQSVLEMAKGYEKDWNYGNAIHHGHLVLGRAALLEGDVNTAKQHLFLAAKMPGSPQLNSFGPDMTLAKELLEKKETTAVLDYLDACLLFWKGNKAKVQVDSWKLSISKGEIPNFNVLP